MVARFNPPPGWRVPAGFRPEPGWAPDPSWPPAPAGWEYWIDDAGDATTVLPRTAALPAVIAPPLAATTVSAPLLASPPPPPPAAAPAPLAGPADEGPGALAKLFSNPRVVTAGVAIACFAFGLIIGVVSSVVKAGDANQAKADAAAAQAHVSQEQKDLEAQQAQLQKDQDALTQAQADVTQREQAVSEKETQQASEQQQLDQQKTQQAQQPQQTDQTTNIPRGYQTCAQLQAEGVPTPIKKGSPGYSRLNDLDNNGWACE
ncbi:MAG: excalibur calcium-binding domain-containing protein [Promicromonosporaceae bacterium]|nr:excalibur calcium-binding domain-containing protein [Promicromonosporaceae bacterium]